MARPIARAIRAARAGRGRWMALCMLGVLCLPFLVPEIAPFERLQYAWLDFYQYAFPRERKFKDVVIVEIDEYTLHQIGEWPWPRTQLAELVQRIADAGAAAIGLDMILSEPDQTSPEALIPRLSPDQGEVIAALSAMTTNDARLADVMRNFGAVVIGLAGVDNPAFNDLDPLKNPILLSKTPVIVHGGDIEQIVRRDPYKLVSLVRFQQAAAGQGVLNADLESGVLRRVPLVTTDGVAPLPALALELYRIATHAPSIDVQVRNGAVAAVRVGDVTIPTQPDGAMWIHFSTVIAERYLPAVEVLRSADPEALRRRLEGKIVLIGVTGLGLLDERLTPRRDRAPGTDVHAQMLESFFDKRFLQRPGWMPYAEVATLLVLGGLMIWATPVMRRFQAVFLLAATLILTLALGFGLFRWAGLLFDAANVLIMLFAVFASLIVSALIQADHERRVSQRSLRIAREARARIDGELQAARDIQLGILPDAVASFPREPRFQLAASIEPARTVGGDLYDFFMLDADRLFFHIADVSGKGIPASLFMSITKALTKSVALRAGHGDAKLLTQVNRELARDNRGALFVTAFAAVLDAGSGELRYWTAGHDTPYLVDSEPPRQLDRSQSGPPLCVLEGFEYPQQQVRLAPGSSLVLFTDGVPEAENARGELYGKERLESCLGALPPDADAGRVLQAVRADVAQFVAGAAASDDVTLVVLRWLGPRAAPSAP
jgi:serine phosphatase RsbU (regulator of sigma subunit)/CHASE2 domain-containing sensor protein